MVALNKYKITLILTKSNFTKTEKVIINPKFNYVFVPKNRFFRGFIYMYSFFLISDFFSHFSYANNPEFVIKANPASLLLTAETFKTFI